MHLMVRTLCNIRVANYETSRIDYHKLQICFCEKKRRRTISRVMSAVGTTFLERVTSTTFRHLSEPDVTIAALAAYPPAMGEQPLNAGILGLATQRRAARDITAAPGGLLPHLFTLTLQAGGRLFSVTLLYRCRQLPVRKFGALCCPDFPHIASTAMSDEMPVCA